jgi:uncharacterized repeat protein (TIGR03803 family)
MKKSVLHLLCAAFFAFVVASNTAVWAWTDTVLYNFGSSPTDGNFSYGVPINDPYGNLYGTTMLGGSNGWGAVYVLCAPGVTGTDVSPCTTGLTSWTEYVLYSFRGSGFLDGAQPDGTLVFNSQIAGRNLTLYGTTTIGGSNTCGKGNFGCGTVYELCAPSNAGGCGGFNTWTETVLHRFTGSPDGKGPYAGLITDGLSNLYGTTGAGGNACNCGTVFKLRANPPLWTFPETVMHRFTGGPGDGSGPESVLCCNTNGAIQYFYGTTSVGGSNNDGVVFRIRNIGVFPEAILWNFCSWTGCTDGQNAVAGVKLLGGNVYGMTISGGAHGVGEVYELTSPFNALSMNVLYSFTGSSNGGPSSDGSFPISDVIFDGSNNLYGTTQTGGLYGDGIVFELLNGSWTENILSHFHGPPSDGADPWSGLTWDPPISATELYGTTTAGGSNGDGVVYSVP